MTLVTMIKAALLEFFRALVKHEHQLSSSQKWLLGLVNLSSVVVFWVLSSFLVNDLFESDIYRKPFLITYINTSCFVFYLIPYMRYEKLSINQFIRRLRYEYNDHNSIRYRQLTVDVEQEGTGISDINPASSSYGSHDNIPALATSSSAKQDDEVEHEDDINIYETIKLSFQFIVLWFSANLVTNASLSYTSVASQTILSTTSSFFTLVIGYLYSIEKVNRNKVMGIILSFTGVLIVTKIDASSSSNDPNLNDNNLLVVWGNLLALSGALIYGVYTILLKFKVMIPNSTKERYLNTHLFFGFVGVYCLIFVWPVLVVLHYTNVETFELPSSSYTMTLLLTNAFITFISDFCWCKAVLLTSPLTVTVGLSLTIPLAMVGDWIIKGFDVNGWYLFGATIVTIGFLVINKDEQHDFVEIRDT